MSKKKYYYVSGNTAKGFVNYLETNIVDIKQIIVLKHPSHILKTALLEKLMDMYQGDHLEILRSAHGTSFLDGFINREKSLAVIDDVIAAEKLVGAKVVDLTAGNTINVSEEEQKSAEHRQKSYTALAKGLKTHDLLEGIYIKEMDFNKADELAEAFIKNLLKDVPKKQQSSHASHRLFGTSTADGAINEIPNLIENIGKRYYVKGRAGTGKSFFMNKVSKACEDHGLDVELYHCSFDPNSIDMLLVPALDMCMFDSTDPHEFLPERSGDTVIDLYEKTVTSGTDEKFKEEIKKVTDKYKAFVKEGIEHLKQARHYQNKVEEKTGEVDKDKFKELITLVTDIL